MERDSVIRSGGTAAQQRFADHDNTTVGGASGLERWALGKTLTALGSPRIVLKLWDGTTLGVDPAEAIATIEIRSRPALRRLLWDGDIGFGDEYSAGQIEVHGNLADALVEIFSQDPGASAFVKRLYELVHRRNRNRTVQDSKENIHHHYDISNEFYRLWLDKEMQYTCAYFPEPEMSLESAQQAKLHHVCRKLQLKPGDEVVEAGCGWGSLARHMAKYYGANVKAYNISHEQVAFARARAKEEGYDDRVEYVEDDYRNIDGTFDAFVSVGMLEHVGRDNYPALGAVVNRCLREDGRALIHTIGRNRPRRMNAWIERRIFPGAYPPTLREMMDIVEPWNFSVLDVENLRLHYAETLQGWIDRFEQSESQVKEWFDDSFVRAWRLYLHGSKAAFLSGALQLFQVVFSRGRDNSIPWSREHVYRSD